MWNEQYYILVNKCICMLVQTFLVIIILVTRVSFITLGGVYLHGYIHLKWSLFKNIWKGKYWDNCQCQFVSRMLGYWISCIAFGNISTLFKSKCVSSSFSFYWSCSISLVRSLEIQLPCSLASHGNYRINSLLTWNWNSHNWMLGNQSEIKIPSQARKTI